MPIEANAELTSSQREAGWKSPACVEDAARFKSLFKAYVRRLGLAGGMTTEQRAAVTRAATLAILAERTRVACLSGNASVDDLDKGERALRRAEIALAAIVARKQPTPSSGGERGPPLSELLARRDRLPAPSLARPEPLQPQSARARTPRRHREFPKN